MNIFVNHKNKIMKRKLRDLKLFAYAVLFSTIAYACATVPFSNRKQLTLLPSSTMLAMSFQQYGSFLKENPPVNNTSDAAAVKKVGQKISNAVDTYMRENKIASRIKDFKWEFNLVNDNTPNAWCMPGGKVVFYSGILPFTQNEEGIAVVMGHEIAHAIARHGNERMSQQLLITAGGVALDTYLQLKQSQQRQLFMTAYGLGSQVGVVLPYSRAHETEADKLGLIFMTMAGYEPEAAVSFWERMKKSGGQKPPEFLSTHPSNQTRINNLKKFIPKAKKYAQKQQKKTTTLRKL